MTTVKLETLEVKMVSVNSEFRFNDADWRISEQEESLKRLKDNVRMGYELHASFSLFLHAFIH